MTNIRQIKADYDKARRDETRANNEMSQCETQTENQQAQLDTLLSHREECVEGLRTAKQSGLNIIQIREYQLLLKHLDGVVKEQQGKVDICQVKYEKCRDEWMLKNERLKRLDEMMKEAQQEEREQREREINGETGSSLDSGQDSTYIGVTGKRLGT